MKKKNPATRRRVDYKSESDDESVQEVKKPAKKSTACAKAVPGKKSATTPAKKALVKKSVSAKTSKSKSQKMADNKKQHEEDCKGKG